MMKKVPMRFWNRSRRSPLTPSVRRQAELFPLWNFLKFLMLKALQFRLRLLPLLFLLPGAFPVRVLLRRGVGVLCRLRGEAGACRVPERLRLLRLKFPPLMKRRCPARKGANAPDL
jgi:hypothetical protein